MCQLFSRSILPIGCRMIQSLAIGLSDLGQRFIYHPHVAHLQTSDLDSPMIDKRIPEELVSLLHAISEDKDLCERLFTLQELPSALRQVQLFRIAACMRAAGEDEAVVDAVSALAEPPLYDAACSTLRELGF